MVVDGTDSSIDVLSAGEVFCEHAHSDVSEGFDGGVEVINGGRVQLAAVNRSVEGGSR